MLYPFGNNQQSNSEDFLNKSIARNDMASTIIGSLVSLASIIAPLIITLSDADNNVKMFALGGGGISTVAGAAIARQQPNALKGVAESRAATAASEDEEAA